MRNQKHYKHQFLRENSDDGVIIEITKRDVDQMISSLQMEITNDSIIQLLRKAVAGSFPIPLRFQGQSVILYNGKLAARHFGIIELVTPFEGNLTIELIRLSKDHEVPHVALHFTIGLPKQLNSTKAYISHAFKYTSSGFRYTGSGKPMMV